MFLLNVLLKSFLKKSTPGIAINGFGRIGRQAFKAGWGRPDFRIVAINDLADSKTLAYLLKYDSNYGVWDKDVKSGKGYISVDGVKIPVLSEKDPALLPWEKLGVDVVIESTGFFRTKELANKHIEAGAKKVVMSAPAKGGDVPTYVIGANHDQLKNEKSSVINNASCTTNCTSPVMSIMQEAFGVKKSMMTTIHGYTSTQKLVDAPHKDLRRGRAAAVNMIPTTTGAAKATIEAVPTLKDKFDGIAIRIPIPTSSLSDITLVLKKKVTVEEVNRAFKNAVKKKKYKGIVSIAAEHTVSSDIVGDSHSAIIDLEMTRVVGGDLVKVIAWYDNEWGYANRLVELTSKISKQINK